MEGLPPKTKQERLSDLLDESQESGNFGDSLLPGAAVVGFLKSDEIIPANEFRKWLVISNVGGNHVFLSFGHQAENSKGVFLAKDGGQIVLGSGFNSKESINAISAGGNSLVVWQEAE